MKSELRLTPESSINFAVTVKVPIESLAMLDEKQTRAFMQGLAAVISAQRLSTIQRQAPDGAE
jgi:hypothetical protein